MSPRPEDEAAGYIDHRASALPLVEAMEALGGLVQLHLLTPPTYPALNEELLRARAAGQPYHVVHFDGHGVYDRQIGLGGLCFEAPEDAHKLQNRRHQTCYTDQLGPLLRDHGTTGSHAPAWEQTPDAPASRDHCAAVEAWTLERPRGGSHAGAWEPAVPAVRA